jgi:hypothetical protein
VYPGTEGVYRTIYLGRHGKEKVDRFWTYVLSRRPTLLLNAFLDDLFNAFLEQGNRKILRTLLLVRFHQ